MPTLEEVYNDVLDYCKGKFSVFHAYALAGNPVKWDTTSYRDGYKEFLEVAAKSGVKVVYVVVEKPNKANAERLGHANEIVVMDIVFFLGNVMHKYTRWADWYTPPVKSSTKVEEPYFR